MTVPNNYAPIRQLGNGVTTQFSAIWSMISATYALVELEDATTGVRTTVAQGAGANQYQISITSSGFTVTMGTAPTSSQYINVSRVTDQTQTQPYRTSKGFQGEVEENSFDKLTAMVQDARYKAGLAITIPSGETTLTVLPSAANRANKFMGWDASGNVIASTLVTTGTLYSNITSVSPAFSDTNVIYQGTYGANSYVQGVIQNTNAGATASADIVVANNLATATTYYGNFGMNSSGFTGFGSFNKASAVYLSATSGDLVVGTTTANAIHFVYNGSTTDAAYIDSTGFNVPTPTASTNAVNKAYVDAVASQGKNKFINGNFDVWQRGTSFTIGAGTYGPDRWRGYSGSNFTMSQQSFTPGQTSVPYEPKYYCELGAGAAVKAFSQRVEGVRTLAGQNATLSFYAKADAATSFSVAFNQYFGSSGSAAVNNQGDQTVNLTTSWQKFTLNFSITSVNGKTIAGGDDYLEITWGAVTAIAAARVIDIAQAQLEVGSVATTFEQRLYAQELLLCQRYFLAFNASNTNEPYGSAFAQSSTLIEGVIPFPVPMRVAPSGIAISVNSDFGAYCNATSFTSTSTNWVAAGKNGAVISLGVSGATTGTAGFIRFIGASGQLQFTGTEL